MKLKGFIYLIIALLIYGCAQVVPLTGGDKDETPPKELKSTPENKSINFAAKTITIEFNEFIRLQNLQQQLIVSPVMEKQPEINVKGKKLVIQLKEELTPNTTYSINFGNAIIDITENNPIPNYKYVFSTGNYLDSLSFSGNVLFAQDLKPKEKVYVMLYQNLDDSVPYLKKPKYVAITDKEGNFSVSNIAKGTYKVFALEDINSNYIYDLPNEQIAFFENTINLDTNLSKQQLFLFEEKQDNQYVKKVEHKEYGKVIFYLNQPSENVVISTNIKEKIRWYIEEKNNTNDTIIHWLLGVGNFKEVDYYVREGKKILDTSAVTFIEQSKFKDTTLSLNSNITPIFDLNKNILLSTPRPINTFNQENITLLEDSVPVKFEINQHNNTRNYEISYSFKENTDYVLQILPETFQDILGLKNDSIITGFKTKKESDYGNIILKMDVNFETPYILQLLRNNKVIDEKYISNSKTLNYSYLTPGDYALHLIIDKNNNKKWDTGDYLKTQQPETVIHYQKAIKIRPNWDNEIIWNIRL